jgi:transposase
VVIHSPQRCRSCAGDLTHSEIVKEEIRQVFDFPEVRAVGTEHRAESRRCRCGTVTTAPFPLETIGPTCYGPSVRALLGWWSEVDIRIAFPRLFVIERVGA